MSTRRKEDESPTVQAQGSVTVARVPVTTPVFAPANVEKSTELLHELRKRYTPTEIFQGSVEVIGDKSISGIRDIADYEMLVSTIADLACSRVFSGHGIFMPNISYVDQVRMDFCLAVDNLIRILDIFESKLDEELKYKLDKYMLIVSGHGDSSERAEGAETVLEEIKNILRVKRNLRQAILDAIHPILYRIFAVRGVDLPPQFRHTFMNIFMLSSEVIAGRGLERIALVKPAEESKK